MYKIGGSILKKHKIIALIISIILIISDQLSKYLVLLYLPKLPEKIVIIPNIIDFQFVANEGAAFGWWVNQRWVFMSTTVIFLVISTIAFFLFKIKSKLVLYSLMLIISGGIGNLIDRVFRGYVIDFINFSFFKFYVFNIADSCIVIGCSLFIIYLLLDTIKETQEKKNNENKVSLDNGEKIEKH